MDTNLVLYDGSIDFAVAGWLHEKQGRTGSGRTLRAYRDTMRDFRGYLQPLGQDLTDNPRTLALCLQAWAAAGQGDRDVSGATFNNRVSIISSFCRYAIRHGLLGYSENFASRVPLRPVQRYAKASPLSMATTSTALKRIDRSTIQGKRDYAILVLAMTTGRRLGEVANLSWEDININGEEVTITWNRTKGGKTARDRLTTSVGRALLDYRENYDRLLIGLSPASYTFSAPLPVWAPMSRNRKGLTRLSVKGLERICQKHLGTSKFHSLRHTFAHQMEEAGAKVSDIQRRLGHSSIATTGEYLVGLSSDENEYAGTLAERLGVN